MRIPRYPPRGKYDHWKNEEPLTDLNEALHLLTTESQVSGEETHLHLTRSGEWKYEIIVPWFTNGSSGGDRTGHDYYQINPGLAERLIEEKLVAPRRIPRMGYTQTMEDELVLTDEGKRQFREYRQKMRSHAESLLKPGVHTDLTGNPDYAGYDREYFRCGPLYFQYRLPQGGVCKIYPEENRIVMPEDEDKAA